MMLDRLRLAFARLFALVEILTRLGFVRSTDVSILRREMDAIRSRQDVEPQFIAQFESDRKSQAYQAVYESRTPLVTVCVATYNGGPMLVERCLPSIMEQDYENLEILVVGDCCTDNTEELVRNLGDDRIKFTNLPQRGSYPDDPLSRWMVAGTAPMNFALERARGSFITHLDHDDAYTRDRISSLLRFIQNERADLVWHPFLSAKTYGLWKYIKAESFEFGLVTTSSIFYHRWLRQIPWDIESYKYQEPGDWNRLRKMRYIGAKLSRHPGCFLRHY
ncbi:MAG: glycosyltransferase family 2 protein [Phycisphaerales bacterium]|nr:MAG: glycosyltransferase family 2 protein [Phycisphaerales bacterium]